MAQLEVRGLDCPKAHFSKHIASCSIYSAVRRKERSRRSQEPNACPKSSLSAPQSHVNTYTLSESRGSKRREEAVILNIKNKAVLRLEKLDVIFSSGLTALAPLYSISSSIQLLTLPTISALYSS